jgi:hypothetical protein
MTARLHAAWARFWPQRDLDFLSWSLAMLACGWGIVFLAPGDTFARAAGWQPFADLQPLDWVWGVGLLALGLVQHLGRIAGARRTRRRAALAGGIWWGVAAFMFLGPIVTTGAAWGTGPVADTIFAVQYGWLWWRLRGPDELSV